MEKLYQKLKDRGFVVVAVDMMEDKDTVCAFVKTNGYTFPVLIDTTGEVGGGSTRRVPFPRTTSSTRPGRSWAARSASTDPRGRATRG